MTSRGAAAAVLGVGSLVLGGVAIYLGTREDKPAPAPGARLPYAGFRPAPPGSPVPNVSILSPPLPTFPFVHPRLVGAGIAPPVNAPAAAPGEGSEDELFPNYIFGDAWDQCVSGLRFADVWAPEGFTLLAVLPNGTAPTSLWNFRRAMSGEDRWGAHRASFLELASPVVCTPLPDLAYLRSTGQDVAAYGTVEDWIRKYQRAGFMIGGWYSTVCARSIGIGTEQLFAFSPPFLPQLRGVAGAYIVALPYEQKSTRAVWETWRDQWA